MRHGKKFAHLGRKTAHRKYMLANMACSLIEHKSINTTVSKAKALKRYIEPLITKSKNDSTHNRRIVFRFLKNKYAVSELFRNISEKVADRPGGYTRVIKLGNRLGDNASMAMIEFVDFNSIYSLNTDSNKKTRRRRKSKSSSKNEIDKEVPVEDVVVEEVPVEDSVAEEVPVDDDVVEKAPAEDVVAEKASVEDAVDEEVQAKDVVENESNVSPDEAESHKNKKSNNESSGS
jgi:large subunit ribosomal protein L17